jgi:hypothetical protein
MFEIFSQGLFEGVKPMMLIRDHLVRHPDRCTHQAIYWFCDSSVPRFRLLAHHNLLNVIVAEDSRIERLTLIRGHYGFQNRLRSQP